MHKFSILILSILLINSFSFAQKKNTNTKPYPYGNPIITHMYTADAAPKVMPDGRLWMVTSVDDENGGGYATMHAIHAYSTADMINWVDHGEILGINDFDVPEGEDWAIWAPDIVYRNGIYYLYFPMRNVLKDGTIDRYIAVAESNSMHKRFNITNPRIKGVERAGLDPSVFIDDDGMAYLYWNQTLMGVLQDNMREIDGNMFKLDIGANNFMEAAWMHKRNGIYYFNYHTKYNGKVDPNNPDDPERPKSNLDYSMGSSPIGPLTYKGTMNYELGLNVENGPHLPYKSYVPWRLTQSNHGGVVEYHGQDYLFYHTSALSSWRQDEFKGPGTWTQRSVCIDELNYNPDGTIIRVKQTVESVKKITIKQPFHVCLKLKKAIEKKNLEVSRKTISTNSNATITFQNINLGTGYYYFGVNVLKTPSKGKIEIRKNHKEGYLMGTILLNEKSKTTNKGIAETFLREANGVQDIVLIFKPEANETIEISKPNFFAGSPQKLNNTKQ